MNYENCYILIYLHNLKKRIPMVFITDAGLVHLKQYQYKSGGYSWLDNKMNYFWVFCVELVPKVINTFN